MAVIYSRQSSVLETLEEFRVVIIYIFKGEDGSSGGGVVKLLACGARGPGFDSRPRHLNFVRLVISSFQVKIWLKDR